MHATPLPMRNGSISSRSCRLAMAAPSGAQTTFFVALLWMARTGAAWRELPERLGKRNVVYQRYAYWCDKGHFERLFQGVQQPDLEKMMMDSTCCKAHQASAGARKTSGPQAICITRGGPPIGSLTG
jgi:transposase